MAGRTVPHALRALPRHALRALVFSPFPPLRRLPRRLYFRLLAVGPATELRDCFCVA